MLPQKKNPDAAELARGKAPRLIADLSGLLGVMSGLPLAYNKDMQEDKEYLFDAIDTVDLLLPAMAGMVAGARFRADRMAAASSGGFLAATDLADHLVTLGLAVPAGARGGGAAGARVPRPRRGPGGRDGPRTSRPPGWTGWRVPTLTAEASVEAKRAPGGTARAAVADQLAAARRAGGGVVTGAPAPAGDAGAPRRATSSRGRWRDVALDLLGCVITVDGVGGDDRRDRALPAGRPRVAQLPRPARPRRRHVRPARAPLRLPRRTACTGAPTSSASRRARGAAVLIRALAPHARHPGDARPPPRRRRPPALRRPRPPLLGARHRPSPGRRGRAAPGRPRRALRPRRARRGRPRPAHRHQPGGRPPVALRRAPARPYLSKPFPRPGERRRRPPGRARGRRAAARRARRASSPAGRPCA